MKKSSVKYRYALNENDKLIEIHAAHEMGGVYHCPECGEPMILKCGAKKAWHFAHEKVECDYNHYLHTIAEQRIQEWFNAAKEIPMVLQTNEVCSAMEQCRLYEKGLCNRTINSEVFNVKKFYCDCECEKQYVKNGRRFIADLICYPFNKEQEPLFIEICVTHSCEQEKLDSGIRIIEFVITSEEDIDMILNNKIEASDKIRLYNFHPKERLAKPNNFYNLLHKFIVYPSKKCDEMTINCAGLFKRHGEIEITTMQCGDYLDFADYGGFFSVALVVALLYDKSLKHCCICEHYLCDSGNYDGICRITNTSRYSNGDEAQKCQYYCLNEESMRIKQEFYFQYRLRNPIDIWLKKGYN